MLVILGLNQGFGCQNQQGRSLHYSCNTRPATGKSASGVLISTSWTRVFVMLVILYLPQGFSHQNQLGRCLYQASKAGLRGSEVKTSWAGAYVMLLILCLPQGF